MQPSVVSSHGSYRYASKLELDHAIKRARAHLADTSLEDVAWIRFFVSDGSKLTVNVDVADRQEHRFAAANMFLILAHGAVDGAVEPRWRPPAGDVFAYGA